MAEAGDAVTVVSSQIGDWDTTKALSIMENILLAYPEVKGVFCANDNMAIGAVPGGSRTAAPTVVIVGFDAEQIALDAVAEGHHGRHPQQQPALMGEMGVENALKYLNGETIDANIGVPVALITE